MLDVVRSLAVRYGTASIAVRRPRPVRGVMPAGSEPSGVSSGVRWGGVAPLLMLSRPAASVASVASVASAASAASAASGGGHLTIRRCKSKLSSRMSR